MEVVKWEPQLCLENSDCKSQMCFIIDEKTGEGVCTIKCIEECHGDFLCKGEEGAKGCSSLSQPPLVGQFKGAQYEILLGIYAHSIIQSK